MQAPLGSQKKKKKKDKKKEEDEEGGRGRRRAVREALPQACTQHSALHLPNLVRVKSTCWNMKRFLGAAKICDAANKSVKQQCMCQLGGGALR